MAKKLKKIAAPKIETILADTGPLGTGFETADQTLTLSGKAAKKAKVTIFLDGEKVGTVKADKKGTWSFDTNSIADGSHAFTSSAKLGKAKSKLSLRSEASETSAPPSLTRAVGEDWQRCGTGSQPEASESAAFVLRPKKGP